MENLVPKNAYDIDETGYWERLPIVIGSAMAVGGTLIVWATVLRDCPFIESAIRGMAGGFLFAVLFPLLFRGMIRAYTSRALGGSGRFATSPPDGDFAHRLLCSAFLRNARTVVGGNLYIGRAGLAFVPFRGAGVHFPMTELRVATVIAPATLLQRIVVPRPPQLLEAVTEGQRARFVLPTPSATIPQILQLLKELGYSR